VLEEVFGEKINVLFERWLFLVQLLNCSAISALLTTGLCMISLRVSATNLANTNRIENLRGFS